MTEEEGGGKGERGGWADEMKSLSVLAIYLVRLPMIIFIID